MLASFCSPLGQAPLPHAPVSSRFREARADSSASRLRAVALLPRVRGSSDCLLRNSSAAVQTRATKERKGERQHPPACRELLQTRDAMRRCPRCILRFSANIFCDSLFAALLFASLRSPSLPFLFLPRLVV